MNSRANEPAAHTAITDDEIIERFGGIRPMASKLGIAVTTVQGWKNRGHIPENRRAEILAAAARLGIDLGAAAAPATPPPSRPAETAAAGRPSDATGPIGKPAHPAAGEVRESSKDARAGASRSAGEAKPVARGTNLPAWVAVGLAVLVAAGLLTRPYWEPRVHRSVGVPAGDADLTRLGAQLDRIEEQTQGQYDDLRSRLTAIEAGGGEAGQAFADQLAQLDSGVDRLERSLQSLQSAQREQAADRESLRADIAALRQQIDAQEKTVADGLGSLRVSISGLEKRVVELEARPVQTGEKIAALALAIGQVEAALDSGQPYRDELNRLEAIARDDKLVLESEALAALEPWADYGIPTETTLYRRFVEIAPRISQALGRSESDNWLQSAWDSVTGIVSIRRTEGGEDLSPVSRAEAALEDGDLIEAVSAFAGLGSLGAAGDAWIDRAQARIDVERQIRALYGQVIEPLAGGRGADGGASAQ